MENVISLNSRRREVPAQPELGYEDPALVLAICARNRATGLKSGNLAILLNDINERISRLDSGADTEPETT